MKTNEEDQPLDETEIRFDLRSVCTAEEIESFKQSAHEAHAASLTEHFINLTLRIPKKGRAA
ncbi:MAG: hypothetical protein WCP45_16465 [Verrucomicrobiota bacterium]